jgi:hypothetical protein
VVEETLEGRADRIKAYNIATVFRREESFDPQLDSIVPHTCLHVGPPPDLARMRDRLKVDYLLKGAAILSARYLRVEALLIDVESGRTVWAETFERSLEPGEIDRSRAAYRTCFP